MPAAWSVLWSNPTAVRSGEVKIIFMITVCEAGGRQRRPPTGTLKRTRHNRTTARCGADNPGGGSLDRFC